jgi:hypothetical protein
MGMNTSTASVLAMATSDINSAIANKRRLEKTLHEKYRLKNSAPKKNNIGFSNPDVVKLRKHRLETITPDMQSATVEMRQMRKNNIDAAATEKYKPTIRPHRSALPVNRKTTASIRVNSGQVDAVARNPVL